MPSSSESRFKSFFPLEVGAVERKGTVHADLLIDGENRLKRRVGERIVGKDGEDHRHGDAVVAAERGLIRPDPLPSVRRSSPSAAMSFAHSSVLAQTMSM